MTCPHCKKEITKEYAAELGSRGGNKTAEKMTKQERSERAKKAAAARWKK